MRILANENFSGLLVQGLRKAGHDVASVKEDAPGSADESVLARAQIERRTVMTFDKGFGDLAFKWGLPAECGVVLLRLRGPSPESIARRALIAIGKRDDWAGIFAVVEEDRIREKPLPPGEAGRP